MSDPVPTPDPDPACADTADLATTLDAIEQQSTTRPAWVEESSDVLDHVSIPHITVQVFSETDAFREVWANVAQDRHMAKATMAENPGGFVAAMRRYVHDTTPDLLIVETQASMDVLEFELDGLAEVCDPGTRLVVVGHNNDIILYRRLLQLGVSNYIVFPVGVSDIIGSIAETFADPGTAKIGRSYAFIGAKGGVGTSTIAQNVAFELARMEQADVLLADMDVAFGTASLNLDVEPNQGLIELLDRPDLISAETLDRVLIKHGLHLNLLGAVPGVEVDREIAAPAVEKLLDVSQCHIPHVVLDIPHVWTDWVRQALRDVDRVVIVSTPEVSSLRNAAALIERIAQLRPNDPKPFLVINQAGMPRRDEVAARDVAATLRIAPAAAVPFDPRTVSAAAGRGKMLGEAAPRKAVSSACRDLASLLNLRQTVGSDGRVRKRRSWFRKAG